jgi:DNA invertase Pin-like site-specific DNA recombinase
MLGAIRDDPGVKEQSRNHRRVCIYQRDLIRTRTAEGRSRAKAQGKRMGRPPSLTTPAQQKEAIRRRARGATLDELARSYNVSRATNSRRMT